jgi:guanosine-3',5'-bis(diphosphate) 3'-pyrophosphohydrolase
MHDIAERGVAAHWRYRERVPDKGLPDSATFGWLRDMVDLLEKGDTAEEALEHSKLALYQDQVFCFTPKGSLISLPKGATPIDFAYAVHTDLGNSAVGAKVNGNHVALHIPLKNGDQVEIIRTKDATPSAMWEQFVVTGRARAEIRRFLRHAQRDEHVKFGRKILEKTFADEKRELTDKAMEEVAKKLRLPKPDDVYADVGRGALRGHEVLEAVFPELKRAGKPAKSAVAPGGNAKSISIRGLTEGIAYTLGQCCHPLPGDRIVGIMTPEVGTVIHTIDCAELDKAQDMQDWLDVAWGRGAAEDGLSVARILVRVKNAPGSLAAVMTAIAANGGNIFNLKVTSRNPLFFEFTVDIEVRDVAHLQNILGALRVNDAVEMVDRVREAET